MQYGHYQSTVSTRLSWGVSKLLTGSVCMFNKRTKCVIQILIAVIAELLLSPFPCRCKEISGWWRQVGIPYWSSFSGTCQDTLWTSHLQDKDVAWWRLLEREKQNIQVQYLPPLACSRNSHHVRIGVTISLLEERWLFATPVRKLRGSRRGTRPFGNFSQASS